MPLGVKARVAMLALLCLIVGAPAHATLPIGPQFRVSTTGPAGDPTFQAFSPAVAYNPQANEYLVVWAGSTAAANEREIWGQFVNNAGTPVGGPFRLSDMGPDGDETYAANEPGVAYSPEGNEYLVVWLGDDSTAPLVDNEVEVFGQRLSAAGTELGANDFRISDMGPDGSTNYGASNAPQATYNASADEYLVVWNGDDSTGLLVDGEREVFGQRLSTLGAELGSNDFRISDMGPDGNVDYRASDPAVAYNGRLNQYVVVWHGDDSAAPLVDEEDEIFAQRLSAAGTEIGANDFRISDMGPDGNANYGASNPKIDYNGQANEYLVVWGGDDSTAPLVDGEDEIFGQRLLGVGTEVGTNDFRISDMGPDANAAFGAEGAAVAYNTLANEYLVVWRGDDSTPPLADDEQEIFGQRLLGSGAESGTNDFRISQMGPDANASFEAAAPDVAFASTPNEYFVTWVGDNDADQEFEIWARRSGGPACTRRGTRRNDVLRGTPGPDRICALGGHDRVYGLGGDDIIILGPGRDRAFGGIGNDTIRGGTGADRLTGGAGRDRLFGERGRDVLLARDRVRDLVNGGRNFDRARVDRRRDTRRSIERLF